MARSAGATQGHADALVEPPPIPPKKREQYHRKMVEDSTEYDHLQHGDQQKCFFRGDHLAEPTNGIADEQGDSYSRVNPGVPQMYPVTRDSVHIPEWQLQQDGTDDESSESGHLPTAWTQPSGPPPLPPKPVSISSTKSEQSVSVVATKQGKKSRNSYQQFTMQHRDVRHLQAGPVQDGEEQCGTTSRSELAVGGLKMASVEQQQDHQDAYEQLDGGQPTAEGDGREGDYLYRAPSLEWDSADLPQPPKSLSSRTAEEVQEAWKRQHEAHKIHSYSEVVIPTVQQKWIDEHDRAREQRSYEEVDFDWNFRSAAAAQPLAHPSVQPKGRDKGRRRSQASVEESVSSTLQREVESANRPLPEGWQAELSHGQIMYWHVPTGKIQFVPPTGPEPSTVSGRGCVCTVHW